MLHPEGIPLVLLATAVGLGLAIGGAVLGGWGWLLVAAGGLVATGAAWASRDPERTPPPGADRLLLAPADGRVVEIAREPEPFYLRGAANRVTIAVPPLAARVLRSPATGTVEAAGGAAPADRRTGVRHDAGVPLLLRQRAGWRPRPAGARPEVGARLSAGERIGLLPVAARVAVAVPVHVELDVEVGQWTVAGETVIGRLPSSASGDGLGRLSEAPLLQIS